MLRPASPAPGAAISASEAKSLPGCARDHFEEEHDHFDGAHRLREEFEEGSD